MLPDSRSGASRQGLIVGQGQPDWDYVAKTAWYWRSDIMQVPEATSAVEYLTANDSFAYILVKQSDIESVRLLVDAGLKETTGNEVLAVYTKNGP